MARGPRPTEIDSMRTMIANPRSPAESTGTRLRRAEGSRSSGTASRFKAWFPASSPVIAKNYAAAASLILLVYALLCHRALRDRDDAAPITMGSYPQRAGSPSGSSSLRICCCSRFTTRPSPMTIRSSAGASGRGSSPASSQADARRGSRLSGHRGEGDLLAGDGRLPPVAGG